VCVCKNVLCSEAMVQCAHLLHERNRVMNAGFSLPSFRASLLRKRETLFVLLARVALTRRSSVVVQRQRRCR